MARDKFLKYDPWDWKKQNDQEQEYLNMHKIMVQNQLITVFQIHTTSIDQNLNLSLVWYDHCDNSIGPTGHIAFIATGI